MAELHPSTAEPGANLPTSDAGQLKQHQPRGPPLHQIYALPAPIRTFPLPTFYPNNPISLFHVAYAWLGQFWSPPPAEPSVVHPGVWSAETSSVHITDEKSIRALWEQGFYGKGNLSRSEPNWLKREQVRRGLEEGHVSEILTVQRREERIRAKWERARLEQEAIRQTRLEEAREAATLKAQAEAGREPAKPTTKALPSLAPHAPVTPDKLLALPNSVADLVNPGLEKARTNGKDLSLGIDGTEHIKEDEASSEPSGLDLSAQETNGDLSLSSSTNGNGHPTETSISTPSSGSDSDSSKPLKRRKSVRFSPKVESATFELTDPPSPIHTLTNKPNQLLDGIERSANADANGKPVKELEQGSSDPQPMALTDKEHLQLMPEEAFFLTFGLGALSVTDPVTGGILSPIELFTLFRQYSYFPPRVEPEEPALQPDDNFLVHYSVYHHFRSLGWVPRGGIKFGVDWMLYTRGPVFDHAEFGLIVIPSYSDPEWKQLGKQGRQRSWQWFHATIRVLSHVTKSLVLVYVDVPPPSKFDTALEKGFKDVFQLYKVREVMVKRWSSNRNR